MRLPLIPKDESLPTKTLPVTFPVVMNFDESSILISAQILAAFIKLTVPETETFLPFNGQSGASPVILMRTLCKEPFIGKIAGVSKLSTKLTSLMLRLKRLEYILQIRFVKIEMIILLCLLLDLVSGDKQ